MKRDKNKREIKLGYVVENRNEQGVVIVVSTVSEPITVIKPMVGSRNDEHVYDNWAPADLRVVTENGGLKIPDFLYEWVSDEFLTEFHGA